MTVSVLHRLTGIALSAGLVVLTIWLVALSTGAAAYEQIAALMQSIVGRLILAGFSFAFFFHLCNGVRHLFWDAGLGFEMRQANASAWSVIFAAIVLTLGLWLAL